MWNQPVYGYIAEVKEERGPQENAAEGTVKEVRILNTLLYINEGSSNALPQPSRVNDLELDYWLELNEAGEIIGGSWPDGYGRVDFAWISEKKPLTGDYKIFETR